MTTTEDQPLIPIEERIKTAFESNMDAIEWYQSKIKARDISASEMGVYLKLLNNYGLDREPVAEGPVKLSLVERMPKFDDEQDAVDYR